MFRSFNSARNKDNYYNFKNMDKWSYNLENIVGKGEIARYEQFSFSHNVFKSCLVLMRQNEYLWSKGLYT